MGSDDHSIPISIYSDWLDIPDDRCPPDHYTLLGLAPAESDPDVVKAAVLSRSAAVRRQSLKQPDLVKALLNQIAQAKNCLTDPQKAREYNIAIGIKPIETIRPDEPFVAQPVSPPLSASGVPPSAAATLPMASEGPTATSTTSDLNGPQSERGWPAGITGTFVASLVTAARGVVRRIDRGLAVAAGKGNFVLHNFFRVLLVFSTGTASVLAIGMTSSIVESRRDAQLEEQTERIRRKEASQSQQRAQLQADEAEARSVFSPQEPEPADVEESPPPFAIAPFQVDAARQHQQDWAEQLKIPPEFTNSIGMKLVLIPPGEFMMGSPEDEQGRRSNERQHRVRITRPFYLGTYEVTQQQWQAVMGNNPSRFQGADRPVETVSWNDCQEFLEKLNALHPRVGWRYSLPTEAQWEYACRAGSPARYGFGDDEAALGDYAWFRENSEASTYPVGTKQPNSWGIYDMHGTVREWCADGYDDGYYDSSPVNDPQGPAGAVDRVFRGGSSVEFAEGCRSASRYKNVPGIRFMLLGFRVAAVPMQAPGPFIEHSAAAEYEVSVDPPSAEVSVTGPGASISGSGGTRTITVAGADGQANVRIVATLTGYESYDHEIQPQAGESRRLEVRLRPMTQLEETTVDLGNGVTLPMLLVPAGSFLMGDVNGSSDEKPVHEVAISNPFYLGKYEVTQQQWEAVMGNNPSRFKGADNPVETVSWNDCQEFLEKLNMFHDRAGWRYSLPTEAQWEYACRAASESQYCFGDDAASLEDYAWFAENSGGRTHPVGQKKPNDWGFYDMHGNVWERCADWFDAEYYGGSPVDDPRGPATGNGRVIRGGTWALEARDCRSGDRGWSAPMNWYNFLGFRVAAVKTDALDVPSDRSATAEYQVIVDPPEATVRVTGSGASISGSGGTRTITVIGANGQAKVRIVAALSGYAWQEQEIQPRAGELGRLELRLRPLPDLEKEISLDLGNGITLPMLLVPAGSFLMGDANGESTEKPVHKVAITKPFYLGTYEVTQRQWQAVMGNNPSNRKGADNPIEKVSWIECQEFLGKLNALHGRAGWRYSLPTEAQWEYACRAGSRTLYGFGDDEASLKNFAWFGDNSGLRTYPVGQKKPNNWGFYDMHGNVWEWCADWYDAGYYGKSPVDDPQGPVAASLRIRVIRGGSWARGPRHCRSANRGFEEAYHRGSNLGFRLAAVASSE